MMHFLFIGSSVGLDFNPFLLVHYTTTLIKQWHVCYVAKSPGHRDISPTDIRISFLWVLSYGFFIYFIAVSKGISWVDVYTKLCLINRCHHYSKYTSRNILINHCYWGISGFGWPIWWGTPTSHDATCVNEGVVGHLDFHEGLARQFINTILRLIVKRRYKYAPFVIQVVGYGKQITASATVLWQVWKFGAVSE